LLSGVEAHSIQPACSPTSISRALTREALDRAGVAPLHPAQRPALAVVHAADNDWLVGVAFGEIDLRGRVGRCAAADRCSADDGLEFVFRQFRAVFCAILRQIIGRGAGSVAFGHFRPPYRSSCDTTPS